MQTKQWQIPTVTGNTTQQSTRPITGNVKAIYIEYAVTPNVATDVTISTSHTPQKTLLTVTDNNTSGWYYPREVVQDTAGATVTYDGTNEVYDTIPVSDHISVTVAQGDSDQQVTVWVLLE